MADRFPSPFEIETPAGAEGWQELYTYSLPFSTDRREYEDSMFWFQDGVHWPAVMSPWDATFYEFALASLSQYNTRHYLIPPALGVDYRVLNGYAYLSPVGVADPAEIEARVPHFLERAGFYFQNWATLYEQWMGKIRGLIGEMEALSFEPLPDKEDLAVVTEGRGMGSGFELSAATTGWSTWPCSCGSTTSSSSTSATPPTWTSSASASRPSPASPTWPSPRWSPGSRSTCSSPTRS